MQSNKVRTANEARARGRGYAMERDANIRRYAPLGVDGRRYCSTCGVDVGLTAVTLDPVPLEDYPLTICRDCAKRVGELVKVDDGPRLGWWL